MNNRTYKRRLLKLADFLSTLPRRRFDFRTWVGESWKGKKDLSCGTTACALGWATTIPSLRRAGLRLVKSSKDESLSYVTLKQQMVSHAETFDETYDSSVRAAEQVFGITEEEFQFLFVPNGTEYHGHKPAGDEAGPKKVAQNIRFFVKHKFGKDSK